MRNETAIQSLINIHQHRYSDYRLASEKTHDGELQKLFLDLSEQSKNFREELLGSAGNNERQKAESKTNDVSGDENWLSLLSQGQRESLLSTCELREYDAKKVYEEVLDKYSDLGDDVHELIKRHRQELSRSHGKVRNLYFHF